MKDPKCDNCGKTVKQGYGQIIMKGGINILVHKSYNETTGEC